MGENFQADLSTGTATLALPFALVPARGAINVGLALSYSSGSGSGLAGQGWNIGVPFVARHTESGTPRYSDPSSTTAWLPEQDRFVFSGNPLVPICLVTNALGCTGAVTGEVMPSWSAGWRYFRPKVDTEFQRIFWSPDGKTWRVQDKSGQSLELGVPLDGSSDTNALETELANGAGKIFRWNLSRQYDSHGEGNPISDLAPKPYNVAKYRYTVNGGISYLSDIYDTPPVGQANASLDAFAHHTRLVWATRPDTFTSYRRGWVTKQAQRLARVDVTSKAFAGGTARQLVRRYHLTYGTELRLSQLVSVQIEGRCATDEAAGGLAESADGSLAASNCGKLPAITFEYTKVTKADGSAATAGPAGFGGIDNTLRSLAASPRDAINGVTTDLLDVNSDGLPDLYYADAARFNGNHAVAVNASNGSAGGFGNPVRSAITAFNGIDAQALTFENPNVVLFDPDGDGIVNFVNMPPLQRPSIFSPSQTGNTFAWTGRTTTTGASLNPKIALANRDEQVRFADVNGDGLVDIIVNAGVSLETYLSLGRYPNGDGKWGKATWTGPNTVTLSADPLGACMPVSDSPVSFGDSAVKLVDINADGLVDIVRARNAGIEYWPGRGSGVWGTGNPATCTAGTQGTNRHVSMTANPVGIEPTGNQAQLMDDVNADGFPDLVLVRPGSTSVWFNVDGLSWSAEAPFSSPAELPGSQLRLADIDGSGTRDLVWGNANSFRYIDLQGGKRPGLLSKMSNGLGLTTSIEYTSSVAEMLAARASGVPWTTTVPNVISVVKRVIVKDGLEAIRGGGAGDVTEYDYRDPMYDGRSHSFRGFRETAAAHLGDAHSPTMITRAAFLTGECAEDGVVGRCLPQNAWMENSREALRGLTRLLQIEDESGVTLSTRHTRYRLRNLYTGLDGAIARTAYSVSETAFSYDTGAYVPAPETFSATEIEVERTPGTVVADPVKSWTLPSKAGRMQASTGSIVDYFGNLTEVIDNGCVAGCPAVDEVVRNVSRIERSTDDASGWLFRPREAYVVGSLKPTEKRQRKLVDFDARGHLTKESVDLSGTLPLKRFHATTGAVVAPAPSGASVDGVRQRSTFEYDAYGNVLRSRGSNGQCQEYSYTADYADLSITSKTYVGATGTDGCGTRLLSSSTEYDRGLNLTRRTTAFNGELAQYDYDGLGRKIRVWSPDPARIGFVGTVASALIEYTLPTAPATKPYLVVRTRTQDGATPDVASYRDTYTYVDAKGRVILELSQADTSAGDAGSWLVSGLGDRTAKGSPWREYEPFFWSGTPTAFPVGLAPTTPSTTNWADAFERVVESTGPDGELTARIVYHGNGIEMWDLQDVNAGPQQGTFKSQTKDGHGRLVSSIERSIEDGSLQAVETAFTYLPTGQVERITRRLLGSSAPTVTRWFRFDSQGRMVLNVEPNTTKTFNANPATSPDSMRVWRYAYNDEGQLVGTSDARGCGVNTFYDAGGRIVAEDFSPCLATQATYSAPNLTTGDGTESFYGYDVASPALTTALPAASSGFFLGRLTTSSNRASQAVYSYDGRGRLAGVGKRVATPGAPAAALSTRYAPRWYRTYATFDGVDRVVSTTTGAEVPELLANGKSDITTTYSKRGRVRRVDSAYGNLISSIVRNARGLSTELTYGDAASTRATFGYDARSRIQSTKVSRVAPANWNQASPPHNSAAQDKTTNQTVLASTRMEYDDVGNPVAIYDDRTAAEWPAGSKPVDRHMAYDGMSRVSQVDYVYAGGEDSWKSPYEHENLTPATQSGVMRPAPHVGFNTRVQSESYKYDWLGNNIQTGDDQNGFYDRSLGVTTQGTATAGPYQLKTASNRSTGSTRAGDLSTTYDDAGNMLGMVVKRSGPCLPAGASCSQRFAYDWDEVGRLAGAKRWDLTAAEAALTTPPARGANVELRYAYDAGDERAIKTAVDAAGAQIHTLYIFQTLEQRRTTWSGTDYNRDASTEVPYLYSQDRRLGRVVVDQDMPNMSGGVQHVLLELSDYLGSSEIVIDRVTGELVERGTYHAYGSTESDYRPGRWQGFREDYKFTGKEEDIEVGLHYFGKRYYAAKLNRWISADPLTIHKAGADLNAYAYVHGKPFVSADPNGECEIVCAMVIGALVSMAIDAVMQAHQNDWQFDRIDPWEVAFAGVAGAAGGAAGAWVGGATTQFFAKPLGTVGSQLAGSLTGGMSGSVTSGITFRGQMAGRAMGISGLSVEDAIDQTFNPTLVTIDMGLGAAGGLFTFGLNQVLKSGTGGARATKPPSQSSPAPKMSTKEIGEVGEAVGRDVLESEGAVGGPLQNKSGHGLDAIGETSSGEIIAIEAKATQGGSPPALSDAQANMNQYVRDQLTKIANPKSNWSAADKAMARKLIDAIADGANVRGIVVETRYVGSGQQFTEVRPWTSATPQRGGFLAPKPITIQTPSSEGLNSAIGGFAAGLGIDSAPVMPMTCYTRDGAGFSCDTSTMSW
jgi:RHS repeat-associated protein